MNIDFENIHQISASQNPYIIFYYFFHVKTIVDDYDFSYKVKTAITDYGFKNHV